MKGFTLKIELEKRGANWQVLASSEAGLASVCIRSITVFTSA